jgi:hypothetical protein
VDGTAVTHRACQTSHQSTGTAKRFNNPGFNSGTGDVVVNNTEIDFFNGVVCALQLPDGVGRYKWTLRGGVLQFKLLNHDPCNRAAYFSENVTYTRTS